MKKHCYIDDLCITVSVLKCKMEILEYMESVFYTSIKSPLNQNSEDPKSSERHLKTYPCELRGLI